MEPILTGPGRKLYRAAIEPILFGNFWTFGPAEPAHQSWGKILFLRNGRTHGYGHANEYRWDFLDDSFRLLAKTGEPTSVFTEIVTMGTRVRLLGGSLLHPGAVYRLEQDVFV